jgi:hypothetical protein
MATIAIIALVCAIPISFVSGLFVGLWVGAGADFPEREY